MLNLIVILIFVSSLLLFFPLAGHFAGKKKDISRLKNFMNVEETAEGKKRLNHKEFKAGFSIMARGIASMTFLDGYKKSIQKQLNRAHVLLKAEEYITICVTLFILLAAVAYMLSKSILYSVALGIIGWLLPMYIVKAKTKNRIKYFNSQLSDAIALISNSLKAGYSFFQAVDVVSTEMTGPIAEEFGLLQKEINFGASTEKALENLVSRVGSDDLELMITAVLIQRQVGGNLAMVLDNISTTIRERIKIKGEMKTLTAQGRMSGLIISILPVAIGFIIYLINPEHMSLLFTRSLGIGILVFSAFMELIGIYFVRKIVNIEV
jgi:tight adherence protein B